MSENHSKQSSSFSSYVVLCRAYKTFVARKEKKKAQRQKKWEQKQLEKKRKLQEFFASNVEGSDDDEEIMRESRLLKKLRKGKITEEYCALRSLSTLA